MLNDRIILTYLLIFFLSGFANLLVAVLYPIYLVDHFGISNTFAGILFACYSLFTIAGYYYWGKHIDRRDPLHARIILMFVLSLVPLTYLILQFVPGREFSFAALLLVFLNASFNGIAMSGGELARVNFFVRVVSPALLEKYWTIDYFLMGIRGILAPILGLTLKNLFGYLPVFALAFLLAITASTLMALFYRRSYVRLKDRGLLGGVGAE
jgi:hypothetical protein